MDVKELNQLQLEQLKQNLFYLYRYDVDQRERFDYDLTEEEKQYLLSADLGYWEIPDELIFKCYAGSSFVEEDFSCSNVKAEIENILRSMCFGNSREWSETMIDKIYKTDTINDNCIEDYKPVTEDIIVSALMEIVFKEE